MIESYIPWSSLGYGEPQASFRLDLAVVVSMDVSGERNGWESLGGSLKEGWAWANASTYWMWGAGGWQNAPLTMKIENYDTAAATVAFARESYQAGDDVQINVGLKEGYAIKSLLVNGVEMRERVANGVLTLVGYNGAQTITVQSEFIDLSAAKTYTVSGKMTATAGTSAEWSVPTGTNVSFLGEGTFATTVGADGAYSVDLPAGTYTVTAAGYASATLTVGKADMTQNFALHYALFDNVNGATVSNDETTLTANVTNAKVADINVNSDRFVLTYRVKGIEGGDFSDGLGFMINGSTQNGRTFQFGYIDGSYAFRITNEWSGQYKLPLTDETVVANGIEIMIVRNGNDYAGYYRLDSGSSWTKAGNTVTLETDQFGIYVWKSGLYLTDISYTPNLDIRLNEVTPFENGTVTLKQPYQLGDDVVLQIDPADNYVLSSLKINGVEQREYVSTANELLIPACMEASINVEVRFINAASDAVHVSGRLVAVSGDNTWSIDEGVSITFAGDGVFHTTTTAGGAYAIDLPAGEYVVTVNGYVSTPITVGGQETNKDIDLVYKLFNDSNYITASADQSAITVNTVGDIGTSGINVASDQFVLRYRLTGKNIDGDYGDGGGLRIYSADPTNYKYNPTFQFGYINSDNTTPKFRLRITDYNWGGAVVNMTAEQYRTGGIEIMIVRDGDSYTGFYRLDDNGSWTKAWDFTIPTAGFGFYNYSLDYTVTDISFAPNHDSLAVTLGGTTVTDHGSVTLAGAYKLGDSVVLNLLPEEGYMLGSIKVNGTLMTDSVTSENKLTIAACMSTVLDIEVEFVEEPAQTFRVSGSVTTSAGVGNYEWTFPQDVELTFVGQNGEGTYYATTNEHGAYETELPAGAYTVSATGYVSAALTVAEQEEQTLNLYLRYNLVQNGNGSFTLDEANGSVRATAGGNIAAPINVNSEQFVINFTVRGTGDEFSDYNASGIVIYDGATVIEYQFLRWGNAFIKLSKTNQEIVRLTADGYITLEQMHADGIQAMLVRDGNTFKLWFWSPQKNGWFVAHTYTIVNEFTGVAFFIWDQMSGDKTPQSMISDVFYTPDFRPITVSLREKTYENGSVTLAGAYKLGDEVTINVVPNENYMIYSLKVNGVEQQVSSAVTVTANTFVLDVEVVFAAIPETTYTVSGSIAGYFGSESNNWLIPQGTSVVFRGEEVSETVSVGANGAYEVSLPAGEYSVTVNGYLAATITVLEQDDQEFNLRVLFDLIQDKEGATIAADESEVKATANGTEVFLNTLADEFVLFYTAKAQDGNYVAAANAGKNVYIQVRYAGTSGYWQFQNLNWSGNFIAKKNALGGFSGNVEVNCSSKGYLTADSVNTDGWKNMIVRTNGTLYWYVQKSGSNEWVQITTVDAANLATLSLYLENTNLYYTGISYTPNLGPITVSLQEKTYENGSVTLAGAYKLGDAVTLNVVPDEGYRVSSLKVNGAEKAPFDGTTLTFTATTLEIDVEAEFVEKQTSFNVSGTLTATAGASGAWAIPEGVQVLFTGTNGEGSYASTIQGGGAYSVDLPAGTFTVGVAGYDSATLTVASANLTEQNFTLKYKLFGDSASATVSADETTLTPLAAGTLNVVNVNSKQFVLTYRAKGVEGGNFANGLGFMINGSTQNGRTFQFGYIDGGYAFRITNEWSGQYKLPITDETVVANGIEIMIVRNGNDYTGYYRLDSGSSWTKAGNTVTLETDQFGIYAWGTGLYLTDVSYTPNLNNAPTA